MQNSSYQTQSLCDDYTIISIGISVELFSVSNVIPCLCLNVNQIVFYLLIIAIVEYSLSILVHKIAGDISVENDIVCVLPYHVCMPL